MNRILTCFALLTCCISITSALRAQEVELEVPTTLAKKERIEFLPNGKYKIHYTAEQIALNQQRQEEGTRLSELGRKLYREGNYAESLKAYEALAPGYNPGGRWEVAEVYASAGNMDKALEWFRKAMYQKVQYAPRGSNGMYGHYPSPRVVLPGDAVSIDDAKKRYAEAEVEVWASWDITAMGRFAILLARKNEYAEAIGVYEQAVRFGAVGFGESWQPALSLGNITPTNFDRHRFEAAVYTMMGANSPGLYWSQMHHGKFDIKTNQQDRLAWLNEALRIKPDFAPALFIKADIMSSGSDAADNSDAAYRTARICLDNAEKFARSSELRAQIQALRKERASRLR